MNNPIRFFASTALVILSLSLASGAGYLKIEGIAGESRDTAHKDWIEIGSVENLPDLKSKEKRASLDKAKRQHAPLLITKEIDKATPALAKALDKASPRSIKELDKASPQATAKRLDKSTPKLAESLRRQPSGLGDVTLSIDGARYHLKGARIVSSETSGKRETLTIHYDSIEIADVPESAAPAQDYNSSRSNKPSS